MQSSFQFMAILLGFHLSFLWVKHSKQEFSRFPVGWSWGGGVKSYKETPWLYKEDSDVHTFWQNAKGAQNSEVAFKKKKRVGHDWVTEPPPQKGLLKNTLLNVNKTHITENTYKTEVWHSELSSGNSLGLCQLPSSPFMYLSPAAYHSSFLSSEITPILRLRATISCSSFWFYHPSVHPETRHLILSIL